MTFILDFNIRCKICKSNFIFHIIPNHFRFSWNPNPCILQLILWMEGAKQSCLFLCISHGVREAEVVLWRKKNYESSCLLRKERNCQGKIAFPIFPSFSSSNVSLTLQLCLGWSNECWGRGLWKQSGLQWKCAFSVFQGTWLIWLVTEGHHQVSVHLTQWCLLLFLLLKHLVKTKKS